MSQFVMDRRRLLQGLGAGSLLMPFVPLLEARGDQGDIPRRIIFLYSSNGTIHESWVPSVAEGGLVLSPILAPLEDHRSRLLVVDGLDYKVCIEKGEQSGHYGGMNTALTGAPARLIDANDPDALSLPTSASIDQLIGAEVGQDLRFRSIECGVQVETYSSTVGCTSHAGPFQPIFPENNPVEIYNRIFADFRPPGTDADAGAERRLADRRSVLDFVQQDLNRFQRRLAAPERAKVDAHLEGIRKLERALETGLGASATASCEQPSSPDISDPWRNNDIPELGRVQMDLLVMAMACDLTRVGTIQYGRAGAQHRFAWLGPDFSSDPDNGPNDATSGIHGLAHNETNPESRAKLVRSHAWYAGEMNYLLNRLASVPEGEGSMLDNTLVVWFNEMGKGGSHALTQTPWVIAGNVVNDAGFRTGGRLVSAPEGTAHNRLLVSLCRAMGLTPEYVGDADEGREPLSGIA